ncbi:MAG: CofH family radical SAM protein [Synechococcaceae cyanobacterium]|nr:CofH family radical SAM protein [Synechococcaceae cyanobacterium]
MAQPWRNFPLEALIAALAGLQGKLAQQPPHLGQADGALSASPMAGLALALLALGEPGVDQRHAPEQLTDQDSILRRSADLCRRAQVGDTVTYVINRNLNASNHCQLRCGFCAFRRDEGTPGAYRLALEALQQRAAEAAAAGATELCLQAGLDPHAQVDGSHLRHAEWLLHGLAEAAPGIHLHAFSPQELLFIAERDGISLDRVLERLKRKGLGSVPGTAAEVLSDAVRRVICPEKLSSRAWMAVMLQVHRHGLWSTSTLMAGHLEGAADRAAHLLNLLALQRQALVAGTGRFSEFVLLPFIGAAAPAPLRQRVGRDQPDGRAMLRLTAQARLLLGPWIPHHQPSWVKLTLPVAAEALDWGCDDLGGTLMEEHITTMAGARGGTGQSVRALRQAALDRGRPVRQRTTLYGQPEAPPP